MKTMGNWLSGFLMLVALSFAGAPLAQTTTTVDVRNFEVIAVDGDRLVFRDQKGTHEITVPDDFRFTVDGKKLSVKEMKPGMKGQATVTSKTTVVPVTVTEIRQATVVDTKSHSLTVRGADGLKRFTQEELDQRGVKILKDGKVIGISDLRKNDVITATIVSKGPPVTVSEKEVEATLAQAPAPGRRPRRRAPAASAARTGHDPCAGSDAGSRRSSGSLQRLPPLPRRPRLPRPRRPLPQLRQRVRRRRRGERPGCGSSSPPSSSCSDGSSWDARRSRADARRVPPARFVRIARLGVARVHQQRTGRRKRRGPIAAHACVAQHEAPACAAGSGA